MRRWQARQVKNQKRQGGSAKHKTPIQPGSEQHKLQWADRQLEETRHWKTRSWTPPTRKQPGESANHNAPIQLSSAQHKLHGICWQLDGWNPSDPQEGEGAGSWRYWHFFPWTHPVGILWKMHAVLAFCSAVIAFPFPLALPFGEVFDSDDEAMAAGALVGCNFFGKLDFNKFSIDCALMSSLSSSKCSCNLFQRWSKSRSGDWASLLLISSMVLSNLRTCLNWWNNHSPIMRLDGQSSCGTLFKVRRTRPENSCKCLAL